MNRLLNELRAWSQARACLHPRRSELLALLDDELNARRQQRVMRHLDRCVRCRIEAALLEDAALHFREAAAEVGDQPVAAGLSRLQTTIHAFNASRFSPVSFAQTAQGQALAAELEIYLGAGATATVLNRIASVPPSSREVITAVRPVLQSFLGADAAAAIAAGIVLLCDSESGANAAPDSHYRL
jgi:anti-sigma factor RsiW